MHIGLIGGIGPAATEHYYRGLIERHSRAGVPLELTIVHADVRELSRNVAALARETQAAGICRVDRTLGRGWRATRRRDLDGRPFLHRRA